MTKSKCGGGLITGMFDPSVSASRIN